MAAHFHPIPTDRRLRGRMPIVNCPVCNHRAYVRSSEELSAQVRRVYYVCSHLPCSMVWEAQVSVVRVISPSGVSADFRPDVVKDSKPPGHEFGQEKPLPLLSLIASTDPPAG